MIKESITIDETIDFLNELLKIDHRAIDALFSNRISCNQILAKHPSVQVGILGKTFPIVGFIGILNGFFGTDKDGWGFIGADYEDGSIVRFKKMRR